MLHSSRCVLVDERHLAAFERSILSYNVAMPPYFKQENNYACSLAVLRMVLAHFGHIVSERELLDSVASEYGKHFKNIWNPTIAKLACEYGVSTTMYADWPLFKRAAMKQALVDHKTDPKNMNISQYENPDDADVLPEPLSLAYKEMFRAVEAGCGYEYRSLDEELIRESISSRRLIQTSIRLGKMYSDGPGGYHSILVYALDGQTLTYHDPYRGPSLECSIDHLLRAAQDTGAAMVYGR